jgi:putative copper export protein
MIGLYRALRLIAMVVWVGGLIFFAFVVAPVSFNLAYQHQLPSTHEAGLVVAGTLAVLHPMGLVCGIVFLFATALLWFRAPQRLLTVQMWLVVAMMAATAYVQFRVIPAMERDRMAAGGAIDTAPLADPSRVDFERLHGISEKVEGAALLLGLGVVVTMGFEDGRPARPVEAATR